MDEYKAGKIRLQSMLEDSGDKVVEAIKPQLKTGRKWKVQEAMDSAKESLKIREITGHTQTNRQGLGVTNTEWWSKAKGKAKRDMMIQEMRKEEDQKKTPKSSPAEPARAMDNVGECTPKKSHLE